MRQSSSILLFILFLFTETLAQIQPDDRRKNINQIISPEKLDNVKEITLNHVNTSGEWITFKNWNEGNSVVAENDSIVWMGTSVGLVRWNVINRTYKTFDETNGLNFTSVNSLAFDHKKQLWLGTGQGLVKYANGIFVHFNYLNSPLPNAGFTGGIIIDSSDRIISGIDAYFANNRWNNNAIVIYDGTSWQLINLPVEGCYGCTPAIGYYNDTVYIGGYSHLYIYTKNGLELNTSYSFGTATSFTVDSQNNLWIRSNERKIIRYSGGEWSVYLDEDKERIGSNWNEIWNDPDHGLWLSHKDAWYAGYGPYRLDFQKRQRGEYCSYGVSAGICPIPDFTYQFSSHYALNANNQFFATRWGLFKYNGSSFQSYIIPYTLRSNTVYSLGASPTGDVYIRGELITQITNGISWDSIGGTGWIDPEVKFKPDGSYWHDGIHNQYQTGLDFDGYNALWAAYGYITTLNSDGMKQWAPKDIGMQRSSEYYSPQFMDIAVDKNENVWITGWYNGSVMYDRTYWHPYYSSDTILPNSDYDRIYADSRNRIWFGTNQSSPNYGFTVLENGQWKTYSSSQRYGISYVFQIAEDHFGNVWLATGGGLIKYDGSTFTVFDNTNSQLNTNTVYAVTVDLRNNIWVGTNSGLYVYNPSGVQLGSYSYSSPVDSFSIIPNGRFAIAKFLPTAFSGNSANYQLQRGRSTSKFWPVAETGFVQNCCTLIYLTDTSNIIGKYYYRIKRITSDGKTAYSSALSFNGGEKQVHLVDCQSYFSGNQLFFKFKIQGYSFITGIEILRSDISTNQSKIVARLSMDAPKDQDGYFIVSADSLQRSSTEFLYTLNAVFTDSSRILLATRKIISQLPSTFTVSNNYPNPFNGSTSLDVRIPNPGKVILRYYDILGREILPAIKRDFEAGYQIIQVNLNSLETGLYFCTVEFNNQKICKKLILLK